MKEEGASEPKFPTPKVGPQFWFDRSEEMVKDAPANMDNSAAKLRAAVLWIYGLFIVSSVFSIKYNDLEISLWVILLFALPYPAMCMAYWYSVKVELPAKTVDSIIPENPDSIEEAYTNSLFRKQKKLDAARRSALIAFILVGIVLPASFILENTFGSTECNPSQPSLTLALDEQNREVGLYAKVPKNTEITYRLRQWTKRKNLIPSTPFNLGKCGPECMLSINIPDSITKIAAEIKWKQSDGSYAALSRSLTITP